MKLPPNMTEEEVVKVMQKVAKGYAHKFRFGYFTKEDIEQEAYVEAIKGMEDYDGKRPLENFLRVHIHNRLKNLKRNKYERLDKPCDCCPLNAYIKDTDECTAYDDKEECELYRKWLSRNTAKKNLMNPVGINMVNSEREELMYHEDDILGNLIAEEILEIVEKNLTNSELRKDWIKLRHGLKVPKHRRVRIREEVMKILEENNIDVT